MKRKLLADRAAFLFDKQEALVRAASDFSKAMGANPGTPYERETARRLLMKAGVDLGLACKRYLGGRTDG